MPTGWPPSATVAAPPASSIEALHPSNACSAPCHAMPGSSPCSTAIRWRSPGWARCAAIASCRSASRASVSRATFPTSIVPIAWTPPRSSTPSPGPSRTCLHGSLIRFHLTLRRRAAPSRRVGYSTVGAHPSRRRFAPPQDEVSCESSIIDAASIVVRATFDFLHLQRQLGRREDALVEQDIGEGHDPALVVAELRDHLRAQRLDTAAFLLGVDELVKVEHVGQRMAALLPGLELVIDALDGVCRQSTDVVGQAVHQFLGVGHGAALATPTVAGTTPIMVSRVTRAASSSSLKCSVPAGRF